MEGTAFDYLFSIDQIILKPSVIDAVPLEFGQENVMADAVEGLAKVDRGQSNDVTWFDPASHPIDDVRHDVLRGMTVKRRGLYAYCEGAMRLWARR